MTKEEILAKYKKVFYEDMPGSTGTAIEIDDVLAAMEEYKNASKPNLTLSATTYLHPSGALVIEYPGNPLLTIILGDRKATTLIEGLESIIAAMQLAEIVPDDIPTLGADGVLRDSKGNPVND